MNEHLIFFRNRKKTRYHHIGDTLAFVIIQLYLCMKT